MATNKKAISAYLPLEIEEYLTKYCTEYDITRKDKSGETKPALGTAVVEILKIFFSDENVPSPLPSNVPLLPSNVVTQENLDKAISLNAEKLTASLKEEIQPLLKTQNQVQKLLVK